MNEKVFDISAHNGLLTIENFKQAKAEGFTTVIIRAGYGNDISQKDTKFVSNITNAHIAGLNIGIYWFSYAISEADAITEADLCTQILEPYKAFLTYPIYFDYEYDSVNYYTKVKGIPPTSDLINKIMDAFMQRIICHKYPTGYYANLDYMRHIINTTIKDKYPNLWLADYSGLPDYPCQMQQTGSTGHITGISCRLDIGVIFKSFGIKVSPVIPKPPIVSSNTQVDIIYNVRTAHGWCGNVKNLTDFAGNTKFYSGNASTIITDVTMHVSKGSIKYRVHSMKSGWLGWVTGFDTFDSNKYAGNHTPIDAIEIYYYTPKSIRPAKRAIYHTSGRHDYFSWQHDTETTGKQDGYAGKLGEPMKRLQIYIA